MSEEEKEIESLYRSLARHEEDLIKAREDFLLISSINSRLIQKYMDKKIEADFRVLKFRFGVKCGLIAFAAMLITAYFKGR